MREIRVGPCSFFAFQWFSPVLDPNPSGVGRGLNLGGGGGA